MSTPPLTDAERSNARHWLNGLRDRAMRGRPDAVAQHRLEQRIALLERLLAIAAEHGRGPR